MTPEAVLFDFDFTLVDSSRGIVECVRCALLQLGFQPPPEEKILDTVGLSLASTFRQLTGQGSAEPAEQFTRLFHARADQVMDKMTLIYDSVQPVVRALRAAGVRTAIVSTKLNRRIRSILATSQLEEWFDVIVGADDVLNPKPDPEGLLLALRLLGVDPKSAVYVGDHVIDAQAASKSGIPFIATLSGRNPRGEFEPLPHIAIVGSVRDVPRILSLC